VRTVTYVLALLAVLLVGAGYLLGVRRGRSREGVLKATLEERSQKLTLVEHELLRTAALDPVTGLHTQQPFQEFLEREWHRACRLRHDVSVLMVEVDHFRAYNERQGKPAGDACLKGVADAMKSSVHRAGDILARYGGPGKFGVVLGATDANGAMTLAERVRVGVEQLQQPNPASTTGSIITVSIGVASVLPDRHAAWQDIDLIAAAERALTQAKEGGRNAVVLDSPGV
jgi:two-component system, cell cycle response regulator